MLDAARSVGFAEWIEDYNTRAPHSALGMRSPAAYRTELQSSSLSEQ